MTICFRNNVFCCYLPAHCSHGLQPLDNGVFNAVKKYYRGLLGSWQSLTDSAPVDKINFIKALAEARTKGMTSQTIKSAWKTTGNYPISRRKALSHPEIQEDKEKRRAEREPVSDDDMPKSGRDIMNLAGPNANAADRHKFRKIGLAFDAKQAQLAIANERIRELEAQVERFRHKKRKAIPNPNKKFMQIGDILDGERPAGNNLNQEVEAAIAVEGEEDEVESSSADDEEGPNDAPLPEVRTRSGRASKIPSRYID